MVTAIKINNKCVDRMEAAVKFYKVLFTINNLKVPPMWVKIIAYSAIVGSMSATGLRDKFVTAYKGTKGSVGNSVFKLIKKGYLVKDKRKVTVNPQLLFDFNNDLVLQLNIVCE